MSKISHQDCNNLFSLCFLWHVFSVQRVKHLFCRAMLALWSATCMAAPVPIGESQREMTVAGAVIEVHAYKPPNYRGGPLLVTFHGLSRNIERYLAAAKPIADRHAMLLVLPLLDRGRFPYWRYQGLGITRQSRRVTSGPIPVEPAEAWTSRLVTQLIDEIRRAESNPALDYYLLGHSAGGQIANRMAAFAVHAAKRVVVANPSSYVQPTRAARFPYGFGALPEQMSNDAMLQRYLAQPITILAGTADVLNKKLDVRPPAMAQGATRYERARNVFDHARGVARERGWKFHWRFVEVPGVGHDVKGMFTSPQVDLALFGNQ